MEVINRKRLSSKPDNLRELLLMSFNEELEKDSPNA